MLSGLAPKEKAAVQTEQRLFPKGKIYSF